MTQTLLPVTRKSAPQNLTSTAHRTDRPRRRARKQLFSGYARLRDNVRRTLFDGQVRIEREKARIYWKTGRLILKHIKHRNYAEFGKRVVIRLAEKAERLQWTSETLEAQVKKEREEAELEPPPKGVAFGVGQQTPAARRLFVPKLGQVGVYRIVKAVHVHEEGDEHPKWGRF